MKRYYRTSYTQEVGSGVNFDEFLTSEKRALESTVNDLNNKIEKLQKDLFNLRKDYKKELADKDDALEKLEEE